MKIFKPTTIQWGGLCAALMTAPGLLSPAAADLVPAEEAGWTLVFSDDFDRDEIGDAWEIVSGSWEIEEGSLRGSGTLITASSLAQDDAEGYFRLEFEAATDVQPFILLPGAPPPEVTVSDISSFIHAKDPEETDMNAFASGYFFQFGGFHNTRNRIVRTGTTLAQDDDPEVVIIPDETHQVVVENDGGHLRMYVDGKLILDREEAGGSLLGDGQDRAGFYLYTAAIIDNVKVYTK